MPDQTGKVIEHAVVVNPQDTGTEPGEVDRPLLIALPLRVVDAAVDLDHQPQRGTVEVDDIPGDDVLAPELEAGHKASPQPLPEHCLRGRGRLPEQPRPAKLARLGPPLPQRSRLVL